ncbi:unnamed protein product [Anisakis simplex]|uniref:7TM_GPCR_Srx domain-containing protein n=1 Tax=Anisakis simplex TaxID=6269 RepID=A0A0M3KB50_ANISI|nr:unnamed protein product [Anisakis simplex]
MVILTESSTTRSDAEGEVVGAIFNAAWNPLEIATLLITVDRFVRVIRPKYLYILLTKRMVDKYIAFMWSVYALLFLLYCSPFSTFYYDPRIMKWTFDVYQPTGKDISWFNRYACMLNVFVGFIVNVYIIIYLNTMKNNDSRKMCEKALTSQTAIVFVYKVVDLAFSEIIDRCFEPSLYLNNAHTMLWVVWNGTNPFIYLIFNASLRGRMFKCGCSSSAAASASYRPSTIFLASVHPFYHQRPHRSYFQPNQLPYPSKSGGKNATSEQQRRRGTLDGIARSILYQNVRTARAAQDLAALSRNYFPAMERKPPLLAPSEVEEKQLENRATRSNVQFTSVLTSQKFERFAPVFIRIQASVERFQ